VREITTVVTDKLTVNFFRYSVDFQEREKSGLPRLMEALESNMWSTMQRAQKAVPASSGNSASASNSTSKIAAADTAGSKTSANEQSSVNNNNAGSYVAPTVSATASSTGSTEQNPLVPPASATPATSTTTTDAHPPAPLPTNNTQSTADASAPLDPFDLELEDKEDNEIIDKYANFISEVRLFICFNLRAHKVKCCSCCCQFFLSFHFFRVTGVCHGLHLYAELLKLFVIESSIYSTYLLTFSHITISCFLCIGQELSHPGHWRSAE